MSRVSRISRICHDFVAVKNTIIVIAKYHMIEHSSAALLTHAVKPGASDVISEEWFYVAT